VGYVPGLGSGAAEVVELLHDHGRHGAGRGVQQLVSGLA
jgi:hypothetical protein